MEQYFISKGRFFFAKGEDINNLEVEEINNTNSHIDWAYYITEDGVIRFKDKQYPVKSGDIVFTLHVPNGDCSERDMVIVSNETWSKNILAWNDFYEKRRQNECEASKTSPAVF